MANFKKEDKIENKNLNALSKNESEKVDGGAIYWANVQPKNKWEVIDDFDGHVISRHETYCKARMAATKAGESTNMIFRYNTLKKLRERAHNSED